MNFAVFCGLLFAPNLRGNPGCVPDEEDEEKHDGEYLPDEEDKEKDPTKKLTKYMKLLKAFLKFLQHHNGGRVKKKDARQVGTRIVTMMLALDAQHVILNSMMKIFSGISLLTIIWNQMYKDKKSLTPKTLKVYLLSLEKLCKFSLQRNPKEKVVLSLKNSLPSWRKSIKVDCKLQSEMRYQSDLKEAPTDYCVKMVLSRKVSPGAKWLLFISKFHYPKTPLENSYSITFPCFHSI